MYQVDAVAFYFWPQVPAQALAPVRVDAGDDESKISAGAGAVFELDTPENETVFVSGVGAGRWPTSESVMADLLDLRRFPELIRGALLRSSSVGNTGG